MEGAEANEERVGPVTTCMVDGCGREFDNPYPVGACSEYVALTVHGWARLDFPAGPRYVCPTCRLPRPRPAASVADDQVDRLI